MNKLSSILAFCLVLGITAHATTRRVLFIGNSYTYTNSMPAMLQSFAAAKGDTLIFNQSDPGGYTLEQHSAYAPTITLIFSQPWDIVVLQEQSELPSFPPAQVDTQVYPYAHVLDSMIHANDSCTQTMFMMTWGHADGDPANCTDYPVICTYEGMQERLRESYLQMTHDNNAIVAPVGAAWEVMRDSFPAIWLYQSDSIHPALPGSYLQTCVLYGSIFHKPSSGCTYRDGVSPAEAATIQRIADKVTIDSLYQWQQYGHYPYAGFTSSIAGHNAVFSNTDPATVNNQWDFGDGSLDTASDPLHSYAAGGTYVVTHTAYNNCFSETMHDTIHITATGIAPVKTNDAYPLVVMQNTSGHVTIVSMVNNAYDWVDVFSIDGRKTGHYLLQDNRASMRLIPGFYVYRAHSLTNDIIVAGKIGAY